MVELSDGDEFDLRIAPVAKKLGDATVRMLAYNGSIPGPILTVPQDSEVVVNVKNQGDLEATVQWHGLRLRRLTLDDILLEDRRLAPFGRSESAYTAIGRFGNGLLVNGEPELTLRARQGEVVRFNLTAPPTPMS